MSITDTPDLGPIAYDVLLAKNAAMGWPNGISWDELGADVQGFWRAVAAAVADAVQSREEELRAQLAKAEARAEQYRAVLLMFALWVNADGSWCWCVGRTKGRDHIHTPECVAAAVAVAAPPPSPRPAVNREALGRAAYEAYRVDAQERFISVDFYPWNELNADDRSIWLLIADAALARLAGGETTDG